MKANAIVGNYEIFSPLVWYGPQILGEKERGQR